MITKLLADLLAKTARSCNLACTKYNFSLNYNVAHSTIQTFAGNSDRSTVVINPLPLPVQARCVRINPTAWNVYISMRFDVLGCSSQVSTTNVLQSITDN